MNKEAVFSEINKQIVERLSCTDTLDFDSDISADENVFKTNLNAWMGIAALPCVFTTLIVLLGTQLCGWWTVEPSFTCRGG